MSDARADDDRNDESSDVGGTGAATPGAAASAPATDEHETGAQTDEQEMLLDAYDLDGDGKVSVVEDARAVLGVVDARLEEIADEGGVRGKLADAAHHVIDKLDND